MQPRILVVDDDCDIRETLSDVLISDGYDVTAVKNGQEALDDIQGHGPAPCVVLLDLNMPVMDGRTFLRIREQDSRLAGIPVIVLTAAGDCWDVTESFGVRACIQKPFRIEKLMDAVRADT